MTSKIDLSTPLSLKASFRFPIQSPQARREVIIGALWLLVPGVGWLLNMGHRIMFVHQMHHAEPPFPAWTDHRALFKHGLVTFLGMLYYYTPAALTGAAGWRFDLPWLWALAGLLWVLATIAIPGYMTFYCRHFDAREIFDPSRALRRVIQGGAAYWHAWAIVSAMLALSFLGLLGLGVGFLATSVWFWQSAGFSFATVFTQRFDLQQDPATH